MEYRRMGEAGLHVSVIGLGGNTFGRYADAAQVERIVAQAMDSGINFMDTADIYGRGASEELLGKALRGRRAPALVATKTGMRVGAGPSERGSSRLNVSESCNASLRRLQLDTIDVYQIHEFDAETPLEETLGALDDLVRAGKVRYIGCSNYAAWQVTHALGISDRRNLARFISVQPEYNLLERGVERELAPCCLALGLGIIPYFPLAAGILTGKYRPDEPAPEGTRGYNNPRFAQRLIPATLRAVQRLDAWAPARDHTLAELALAWLAARPGVSTIIAGATRPDQAAANARAAEWHLTTEYLAAIHAPLAHASSGPEI